MAKINRLDKQVAELIAAGEVIERPASIVKELLENAIDAQASAVTVEIKRGGIDLIRITDNGIGIEKNDVPLAFLRHATSKVCTAEDLTAITTLGFRGEALASICAVAKVEMRTKTQDQQLGTRMVIERGETVTFEETGCPNGTTILVRDLFYCVPARLKFLKKDVTEANVIQGIVEKLALSHPEMSFRLIRNGQMVLHTPGDSRLSSAVHAVLGRELANGMLPVEYDYHGIRVTGFVSKPEITRKNRTMQHFFVNRRYVKSATCAASLAEAYRHVMMSAKFPACVLKIDIDPSLVDVNVHPAKTEIRFQNERPVFETVYFATRSAIDQYDSLSAVPRSPEQKNQVFQQDTVQQLPLEAAPDTAPSETVLPSRRQEDGITRISVEEYNRMAQQTNHRVSQPQADYDTQVRQTEYAPPPASDRHPNPQNDAGSVYHPIESAYLIDPGTVAERLDESVQKPTVVSAAEQGPALKYIGELFKTYILFEANDRLIMLDKHAAHERVLYEQLKKQIDLQQSQGLLTPVCLELPAEYADIPMQHAELFAQFGFDFEMDGKCMRLTHVPMILCRYDVRQVAEELVQGIADCKMDLTPQTFDDLLHSMACRAAVMANEEHHPRELMALARRVYDDPTIRHCPHGRPVGFSLTKQELEHKFGRS